MGRRAGLEHALREAIRSGRRPPGTSLPSTRALATDRGLARATVVAAYEHLVAEGYLVSRPGAGTSVADLRLPTDAPERPRQAAPRFRVDFRPGKRVHKVRSVHNHAEMQVDAVTGEILNVAWRPSDLLENLHDGSFFSDTAHAWLMPIVAVGLLFLSGSGIYLWLSPIFRKRKRRRRRANRATT